MQKALFAVSRTNLFSHFGDGVAAVSVRMQDGSPRGARKGMVTKAAQAGEDPRAEVSSNDGETDSRMHPDTRKAYRFASSVPFSHCRKSFKRLSVWSLVFEHLLFVAKDCISLVGKLVTKTSEECQFSQRMSSDI